MKQLMKRIYDVVPFKKFLYQLVKKAKIQPSVYKHLHFKGWIRINVEKSCFKIYHHGYQLENDLFWSGINGNWEKQSLNLWIRLCKISKVILDVGANTGVYSLIAGVINQKAQIFAFEPGRAVALKLRKNVDANSFNIRVFETALSNQDGKAIFHDQEGHNYAGSLYSGNQSNTLAYEVKTQTLDKFVEENDLNIDLIKIDVERHEAEVIEGYKKSIYTQQPTILIEILEEDIANKIQEIIGGIPYLYFNLNENGTIKRVSQLTKSDDFNFLICREQVARDIGLI